MRACSLFILPMTARQPKAPMLRAASEIKEDSVADSRLWRPPKLSRVAHALVTHPCFGNEKGRSFFSSAYQMA
jgi:hypothetical protein